MSLKEIARIVGVSPSTVSRVLNGNSPTCASSQLKDEIWKTARDIGYSPNAAARTLKAGTSPDVPSKRIAVISARTKTPGDDPFFSELRRFVEVELITYGCESVPPENVADTSPDGIVILGRCPQELLSELRGVTENLVCISRNPRSFDIDEVVCNGKAAAVMAMEYLISLGHKKIAYIGDCSYEERYVGYCETLIQHHIPINYGIIIPTRQSRETGFFAMEELLEKGEATAAFCANDITAVGALEAMRKKRQSKALSIISIDNIEEAANTKPMLTTINISKKDMAHAAVGLLLDRMAKKHKEFFRVELPCRIVERDSCRKMVSIP